MPTKEVSLFTRIEQANERLRHICLLFYRGDISENDFRLEREEILSYIEKASKKTKKTSTYIIKQHSRTDITGSFSTV